MGLYNEESMLSFEGEQFKGIAAIGQKLSEGLSFQNIQHRVETCDCQPSNFPNGILVFVSG